MANEDRPKLGNSAGLKALTSPISKLTMKPETKEKSKYSPSLPGTLLVVQFCCKCKGIECNIIFPLETGVHTVEPGRESESLAAFAKGFEPRTIECPACHRVAEYHPKDIGFDILEKPEK
jgi:hypothetical protein